MADKRATTWLRRHARAENALADALRKYFADQASEFLASFADLRAPTLDDVAITFDAAKQHDRLLSVAAPHLIRSMAIGAISQSPSRKRTKALDPHDPLIAAELDNFELPDYARDAIATSLAELTTQSYWRDIQSGTQTSITDILRDGLEKGETSRAIAKRIQEQLGQHAKVRSRAIARTETTMAFNAGHQAMFDTLAVDKLISGKTWLAILDKDARHDHRSLNEVTVEPKKNFSVGGEPAPYPGHWSLSAAQRVNCRCTVVGAFGEA